MLRLIAVLLAPVLALTPITNAHPGDEDDDTPPWQDATGWPDRIITTFEGDPTTSFSVTWRTHAGVGRTIAQIAPATADTRFDLAAETLRAGTQILNLEALETEIGVRHSPYNIGLGRVAYHDITFDGLEPDTLYAWRVQGERGQWSEWFQTRTAPTQGPVSFAYFGDAQNGVYSHWSRVIRMANQVAPEARFYLHAGDLVQKGDSDYNWAEWFHAGGFIHARVPSIPVPGNHENMAVWADHPDGALRDPRPSGSVRVRTPLWRAQFTLPRDPGLPESLHEQAYVVPYNEDLHIFVVDSARTVFDEQAGWLDAALEASTARWKIVAMHHPYFTPPAFDRNARDADRRAALGPIIARHSVDLVLTGHIHTYARTSLDVDGEERTARILEGEPHAVETVFVVSASGAKNSNIHSAMPVEAMIDNPAPDLGELHLDRVAGNTPMFQVITIDGDTLTYAAHTATGEQYDSFTLTKTETGKQLTNGAAAYGDTRLFANTGPYREWWDLR